MGVPEIFDRCPGDICSVSRRYFVCVLVIFDGCPGDILIALLEIFHLRLGDI